jgi:hypothetical protein
MMKVLALLLLAGVLALGGCASSNAPDRDSSGPVVRDVIPAGNAHSAIPVVQTHSP